MSHFLSLVVGSDMLRLVFFKRLLGNLIATAGKHVMYEATKMLQTLVIRGNPDSIDGDSQSEEL